MDGRDTALRRRRVAQDFALVATDLLGSGLTMRFRARGRSMQPFLLDGDVLTVRPVDPEELRPGDIVFYRIGRQRTAAHRLIRRLSPNHTSARWLARGDGLVSSCEVVAQQQLLGRVEEVEREGRPVAVNAAHWRLAARLWGMGQAARWLVRRVRRRLRWPAPRPDLSAFRSPD